MGVGSAFNTALGGMAAYGNQVGYISDNLANVSTPGFKRVDATFQSYVTQSTSTFHSPGGVRISPNYTLTTAGQVSSSSSQTSFAISEGDGFAPVAVPGSITSGVADFTSSLPHYTRACDFSVDPNGYLVNSAGQYLEGMKEQSTYRGDIPGTPSLGNVVGVRVDPTVYKSIPGTASSIVDYNANFPAGMSAVAIGAQNSTASQVTSQVQFFDSLGNSQTLQLTFQKVPVAAAASTPQTAAAVAAGATGTGTALADTSSQWQLVDATIPGVQANAANGGGSSLDLMASLTAMAAAAVTPAAAGAAVGAFASTVDSTGHVLGLTQAQYNTLISGFGATGSPSLYFTSGGSLNGDITAVPPVLPQLTIPVDWTMAATPSGASNTVLTLNYGTIATAITPATGTSQYAGSNLEVRTVTDTTGQAPGSFQAASIDNNGYVVFSYSNGQQLKPYRIPLVTFSDADKLARVTGAVFAGNATLAGSPVARWSGEGDSGKITPSSLEASNVDIADELTQMIVAQRAYSSNGKVITTADQMIQEALGLVH